MLSKIVVGVFALLAISCSAAPGGRIVGGDFAEPGQFPFQVYLKKYGIFECGGSVYNEKYIITAVHCVVSSGTTPYPPEVFTVVVGTNSLISGGIQKSVKRAIPHEKYGNFMNDIALLELADPLDFTETVKPIQIYEGKVPSKKKVVISGWGRIYHGGPVSNDLKYNNLTTLTQPTCGYLVGIHYDGIICINHKSGDGACQGDSGGPAVIDGKLVGVANFVIGGCGTGRPDGYASVPYFADWIKKKTSE